VRKRERFFIAETSLRWNASVLLIAATTTRPA
jgi:hypothetical protein